MENARSKPHIPESFFEHRQLYATPWLDQWVLPNPFVTALFPVLRPVGVELGDLSFNNNPNSLAEIYLHIAIRKLRAGVRVGLDAVTFICENPDWSTQSQLVAIFEQASSTIRSVAGRSPEHQESTLAFHVVLPTTNLAEVTGALFDRKKVGDHLFYGLSLHGSDGVLIIDKSLRHDNAAFVRLQSHFAGGVGLAQIAEHLYREEIRALRLIGIQEIP